MRRGASWNMTIGVYCMAFVVIGTVFVATRAWNGDPSAQSSSERSFAVRRHYAARGRSRRAAGDCPNLDAPPSEPYGLRFCDRFQSKACCIPQMDQESEELFYALMGGDSLGRGCQIRGDARDHPWAKLYCMSCDPQLPDYIVPLSNYPIDESLCLTKSSRGAAGCAEGLLVCEEFALNLWNFGGNDGSGYTKCGIAVTANCLGEEDPYFCGDNLVIPAQTFTTDSALNSSRLFMNGVQADFDSSNDPLTMGPPQLQESYWITVLPSGSPGACYNP